MKTITIPLSLIFTVIIGFSHISCNSQNLDGNTEKHGKGIIPYNLDKPDKKIKLDMILQEISALSYYKNKQLACLHDEYGNIYIIGQETEKIENKMQVAGRGDFEGIEIIEDVAYMLKSNGQLTKVVGFDNEKPKKITKQKTGLSTKNNCEGLGYDPQSNSLLIACKNKPYLDKDNKKHKGKRAVYEYNLNEQALKKKPKYLISLSKIEKITGKKEFMPSGIAVHPVTQNIYIIASAGKLLVVLNRAGDIIDFAHLAPKIFRQPEGICFSPDGKQLFISNEGKKKKGNVLVFNQN
jgi:uncharacterized protein YjiK